MTFYPFGGAICQILQQIFNENISLCGDKSTNKS